MSSEYGPRGQHAKPGRAVCKIRAVSRALWARGVVRMCKGHWRTSDSDMYSGNVLRKVPLKASRLWRPIDDVLQCTHLGLSQAAQWLFAGKHASCCRLAMHFAMFRFCNVVYVHRKLHHDAT